MSIYKNVWHHSSNNLAKWFLETLGVWVSHLNDCNYCVEHHFSGLKRLLYNDVKAIAIRETIELRDISKIPLSDGEKPHPPMPKFSQFLQLL
jgi:AhpD family alkylhydroperoxidase